MRLACEYENFKPNAQLQQQQPQPRGHSSFANTGDEAAGAHTTSGGCLDNQSSKLPGRSGLKEIDSQTSVSKRWRLRNLIWKHRATRTVTVFLVLYVVLWFPYILSRLLSVINRFSVTIQSMQTAASLIGFFNMTLNVFIYGIMNKDFRHAYKRILFFRTNVIHPIK